MRIRCKYRCLGINSRWDGSGVVQLAPVMASKEHPENSVWWDATPSGEVEIQVGSENPFQNGAYYWVDLERLDEGPPEDDYERTLLYRLRYVTDWGGSIEVMLESGYARRETTPPGSRGRSFVTDDGIRKAEFKATINNEAAWPAFVGHVGSWWRVTYAFAAAADDEYNAYT